MYRALRKLGSSSRAATSRLSLHMPVLEICEYSGIIHQLSASSVRVVICASCAPFSDFEQIKSTALNHAEEIDSQESELWSTTESTD
jgi:hypothetical protein